MAAELLIQVLKSCETFPFSPRSMPAVVGQTYTGISSLNLTGGTHKKHLPYDGVRWKPLSLKVAWNPSTVMATTPEN